ncbi:MAG: signal recognition particle-docking protein FtsY [Leptolyngbyaceae cyanobacterium MO_188.B28]|nr:signal recognition particle-docking protein FtsY [Leptolyngbyaceae cyanobacterium MO_188.B28]
MTSFNWFRRSYDEPSEKPSEEKTETTPSPSEEAGAETKAESTDSQLDADEYLQWAKAAYQNIQQRQQQVQAPTAEPKAEPAPPPTPTEPEETTETADTATDTSSTVEAEPLKPETVTESEPVVAKPVEPKQADEAVVELPVASDVGAKETSEAVADSAALEPKSVTEAAVEAALSTIESALQESQETTAEISSVSLDDAVAATEGVSAETAAPVPFWAKADAERQERLERLKETAIAQPEPDSQAAISANALTGLVPSEPDLPQVLLDEAFLWSAEILAAQGRRSDQISLEEITWLKRLRQGLDKTRRGLVNQLKAIVGQGPLNQDAVMEIEALLLQADVGVEATDHIIETLQAKLREDTLPPEQAIAYLKSILRDMLERPLVDSHNLSFTPEKDCLSIWLMTGVNGAGKTTTIGKLAHIAKKSGYTCLIAAADTFRAAAVEQVKVWGRRSDVEVIANPGKNTDPAAVVFDAISAAQTRNTELLLVDTAGRLQNKKNLMAELAKVRRIIDKKAPDAKVESLLVLDATLGQNGLRQAAVFSEAAQLSGVVLTKLDGTAKGGIALAVVQQLGLPIRFIGAGEGIEDLRPFSSYEFVEALISG